MVEKQLKQEVYEALQADLLEHTKRRPLCPIFEKELWFNNRRYVLFWKLERQCRVYLIYAWQASCERDLQYTRYELITNNTVLQSLMELTLYQLTARQNNSLAEPCAPFPIVSPLY